ncbi:MAG TPA: hypothetical protein VFY28_02410 [Candidatus Paceibacterota bacterium]|nr:hypothetical protein [Candidatus Paceibacterota bacterium]
MYLLESQPHLVPILRMYERRAYGGMYRFCRTCWQFASPRMRQKYPRFAMAKKDFTKHRDRWHASDAFHLSMQESIQVLQTVVPLKEVCSGKPTSREADRLLESASYGMCKLGGAASPGDVEMHLSKSMRGFTWPEGMPHAQHLLECFRKGITLPLAFLLNKQLALTSDRMRELRESRKCALTEISVFAYDDVRNQHGLDTEVTETDYFLLTSLLGYVEQKPGYA